MQYLSFFLFTLICGYSLVNSAPVNHTSSDSQETKQQKATAIAHRLLKELAGEQLASNHKDQVLNTDENKDTNVPVKHPETEKIEPYVVQSTGDINDNNNDEDDDDDDDVEDEMALIPTLDDLYEIYGDKYAQVNDDEEESPSELIDDEYILPINEQQLLRYFADAEESDEHVAPVIHTPVMDDSVMKAENHQRRRRSIY